MTPLARLEKLGYDVRIDGANLIGKNLDADAKAFIKANRLAIVTELYQRVLQGMFVDATALLPKAADKPHCEALIYRIKQALEILETCPADFERYRAIAGEDFIQLNLAACGARPPYLLEGKQLDECAKSVFAPARNQGAFAA